MRARGVVRVGNTDPAIDVASRKSAHRSIGLVELDCQCERIRTNVRNYPLRFVAVVVSLVALGATLALSAMTPHRAVAAQTASSGRCPSASGQEVTLTMPLPRSAKLRSMVVADKTLWIASGSRRVGGHGRLLRVNLSSGRVERSFSLAGDPWSLRFGFGSLWMTGNGGGFDGAVMRIDPRSGRVASVVRGKRRFGGRLAITSDAVWVGGLDDRKTLARTVFKIDPSRNAVTQSVQLKATTVVALVGAGRSLWVTGWGAVVKLSSSGRVLFQRRMDGVGWSIALAPGGVWVARPFSGSSRSNQAFPARQLLRIRTVESRDPMIIELATQPAGVVVARGAAWVLGNFLDAGRREVLRTDGLGAVTTVTVHGIPGLIAAASDSVWVAERDPNELSKIC